jgi:chloramphenicol-sensitive protein RarD
MPTVPVDPGVPAANRHRSGLFFAVAAYGLWGVLPAYFLLLSPSSAVEIVDWRILFSLVFCAIVITLTRSWPALLAIIRQPRLLFMLGLAAILIFVNWLVYVYGTTSGQVVETALGYFINPIVTVLLGVILLRERLRLAQWIAVGVSLVAVLVLAIDYGALPWISITLALSFGLYGLVKKRVGRAVDALSGLAIETAWLVPVAIIQLAFVSLGSGLTIGSAGTAHALLLVSSGVVTAVPLLFFASAARRLPLVYMGLVQYLAPVLQFVFGAFVLHESMPPGRWVGFGLVWLALVILSIDLLASARSSRRASPLSA